MVAYVEHFSTTKSTVVRRCLFFGCGRSSCVAELLSSAYGKCAPNGQNYDCFPEFVPGMFYRYNSLHVLRYYAPAKKASDAQFDMLT